MNYLKIEDCDVANHEGFGVTLFVSGCHKRCPGCFSPNTWDFNAGEPFTADTMKTLIEKLKPEYIKGLTLLGGDPLETENTEEVANIISAVRQEFGVLKDIWCFSGYTYEKLKENAERDSNLAYILKWIDVLVDGPFIEEKKDLTLAFRGSSNQRVIDMKATRYKGEVVLWKNIQVP